MDRLLMMTPGDICSSSRGTTFSCSLSLMNQETVGGGLPATQITPTVLIWPIQMISRARHTRVFGAGIMRSYYFIAGLSARHERASERACRAASLFSVAHFY
jgi:hypothetical protein